MEYKCKLFIDLIVIQQHQQSQCVVMCLLRRRDRARLPAWAMLENADCTTKNQKAMTQMQFQKRNYAFKIKGSNEVFQPEKKDVVVF